MEQHGAPWDPSFTFSESELVDVLHFVSGLADGDMGADRGACPARCAVRNQPAVATGGAQLAAPLHWARTAQQLRVAVRRATHARALHVRPARRRRRCARRRTRTLLRPLRSFCVTTTLCFLHACWRCPVAAGLEGVTLPRDSLRAQLLGAPAPRGARLRARRRSRQLSCLCRCVTRRRWPCFPRAPTRAGDGTPTRPSRGVAGGLQFQPHQRESDADRRAEAPSSLGARAVAAVPASRCVSCVRFA
jgi:hypothetical protein